MKLINEIKKGINNFDTDFAKNQIHEMANHYSLDGYSEAEVHSYQDLIDYIREIGQIVSGKC